MALYVVQVPQPAAGADWSYTIPGQYIEDIVAITATLSTVQSPTTLADSSGNGWTLTANGGAHVTYGAAGPFGGGANNYATRGDGATFGSQPNIGTTVTSATWSLANFSTDFWVNLGATASPFGYSPVNILPVSPSTGFQVLMGITAGSPTDVRIQVPSSGNHTFGTNLARGAWHHVGFKWNGAQWTYYLDGAVISTFATPAPSMGGTNRALVGGANISPIILGSLAGVAIYPTALADASFAAHAGASGSAASYKAAVLADSPKALWMLDALATGSSRTVALDVTNGTRLVQEIPSGFVSSSITTTATYSWQTNLNSSTQVPSASTTTVAIPPLILPAGYTVGTRTLDLAATDQWSNITIWWDDTYQQNTVGLSAYEYAPGALLRWRPYSPGI